MFKSLFIIAAFIGAAFSASAAEYAYPESFEASYSIDTNDGFGNHVYYNCDSARSETKALLKQLGAENVSVRCTGGFDPHGSFSGPANITAKFVAATMTKNNATPRLATVKEIKLRSHYNCHFMLETLEGLADTLSLDIVSGPGSCSGGRIARSFTVRVLAFE